MRQQILQRTIDSNYKLPTYISGPFAYATFSMAGSLTLNISYGLDTKEQDDPILEVAEEGSETLFQIANAGAYLGARRIFYVFSHGLTQSAVDVLPICKCQPLREEAEESAYSRSEAFAYMVSGSLVQAASRRVEASSRYLVQHAVRAGKESMGQLLGL